MARVWVIGSLNVDRGWRVPRLPQVGETVVGEMLAPSAGGKGLNQSVAARRMGADVSLVGQVGDDDDGRWLTALATESGIDTSTIASTPDAPTGSALIVVAADGANTVAVDAGANTTLVVGPGLSIAAGDVVVAQLEVPDDAVRSGFEDARAVGATTILNPSPVGDGASLVSLADFVVVNQSEAAALAGARHEAITTEDALAHAREIAATLHGDVRTVVVTLGASGAVATSPAGDTVVAGVAVEPVDTTGAGDCFLGVLAAGLVDGLELEAAMGRANRAAAVAVTRAGTVPAMPTAAELA